MSDQSSPAASLAMPPGGRSGFATATVQPRPGPWLRLRCQIRARPRHRLRCRLEVVVALPLRPSNPGRGRGFGCDVRSELAGRPNDFDHHVEAEHDGETKAGEG